MSTIGPSGNEEPGAAAGAPRRPRGSARRGRIAAVAVSAGAVVALTTVIGLNDRSASGTSTSSSGSSSSGTSNTGNDQGTSRFRPANPSDDFGFGDEGSGGSTSGNGGSRGGFTPHTRSGGS